MTEKLNILCCKPNVGAFWYITKGYGDAFKALGHNFQRWDGSDEQIKKFKPHLYIGCSGWRQNYPQWAKDEFGTKVAIHVNPWGSTKLQKHRREPDINESIGAIQWVEAQRPNFLFCYALEEDIQHMWNNWENQVAPVIAMPNAGNSIEHNPVGPDPRFHCEVGFIGGRWAYKAINIDKYLVPVISKTDAKVFGWGGWQDQNKYRGKIQDTDVNKLFSSSLVCPVIVEPHTTRYGIDIPERLFKIPLGGGFAICDPCKGLGRYVSKDVFPLASNPKEYLNLVMHYLKHADDRKKLQREQRKAILKDHTYLSRVQGFLKFSGYSCAAEEAQKKVESLVHALV